MAPPRPAVACRSLLLLLAAAAVHAALAQDAACARGSEGSCVVTDGEELGKEHLLLQLAHAKMKLKEGGKEEIEGGAGSPFSWRTSGEVVGAGAWCVAGAPAPDWTLKACSADRGSGKPLEVKVLSYNLFWWNLFGPQFRNGNGGSAGQLIRANNADHPYDFMGFQECDDVNRVLSDAGLQGTFTGLGGDHSVAMAYRTAGWERLGFGQAAVAEDRPEQWYGTRIAIWGRFRSTADPTKTVMFVNHHGALPVNTGGKCGTLATAYNILKLIADNAVEGDVIFLTGDFNSDPSSPEIAELSNRLNRLYTGNSFGGVDHIFSSCGGDRFKEGRIIGSGGSDHNAIDARVAI